MGDCQNYGPFWGPYYNTGPNLGDPKRDHSFDNPPCDVQGLGFSAGAAEAGHFHARSTVGSTKQIVRFTAPSS